MDFVLVTGDAYVDHPSFGASIISRLLEAHGYSVAILPQPNWKDMDDFKKFGKPRLGFLVTSGNIDSMIANHSVSGAKRKSCAYSPGGVAGQRPNRAAIVYGNRIREAYGDTAIILGGIEASTRRLAHYDYFDNEVRRSLLLDARADLLVYGMGELAIVEIADALASGLLAHELTFINGTVYKTLDASCVDSPIILPKYNDIKEPTPRGKKNYLKSYMLQIRNTDHANARVLVEEYPEGFVVQNRPARPLETRELDRIYALPFERTPHPMYDKLGGVPAILEVKYSITAVRGCVGGCNFCALSFHQGRGISVRSPKSVINEALGFTHDADFKGYIHDVGGPTANFYGAFCKIGQNNCKRKCLYPSICKNLNVSHANYLSLLRELRNIPGIKKVFVRSGIRYDYILADPEGDLFLYELVNHHVSGRLKIAPEHISDKVLQCMGKPGNGAFELFLEKFYRTCKNLGKEYYIVPYLMSSHPGSSLDDAILLAEYLHKHDLRPEQVQDFYPTPGTLSSCMYYTGINPLTGKRLNVPKSKSEKAAQRALMQYGLTSNYEIVKGALLRAGRKDLIGTGPKALIRPRSINANRNSKTRKQRGRLLQVDLNSIDTKEGNSQPEKRATHHRKTTKKKKGNFPKETN